MGNTYAEKKRANAAPHRKAETAQPSIAELRAGTMQPTAEQMGRRVDLPDAMRAKMEDAFGADLSAVKLYESEAVADAGANAVTQGTNIAFAPGMLDFTSYGGQALLGHELSHVVSQQRGEVTGSGFLNDHMLEARADREGAMAAAGQQVAAPAAAMSSVSAAATAAPMQASKREDRKKQNQDDAADLETYYNDMRYYQGNAAFDRDDRTRELRYQGSKQVFDRYAMNSSRGARAVLSGKRDALQQQYDNELALMQQGGGKYGDVAELKSSSLGHKLLEAKNIMHAIEQVRKGNNDYFLSETLDAF